MNATQKFFSAMLVCVLLINFAYTAELNKQPDQQVEKEREQKILANWQAKYPTKPNSPNASSTSRVIVVLKENIPLVHFFNAGYGRIQQWCLVPNKDEQVCVALDTTDGGDLKSLLQNLKSLEHVKDTWADDKSTYLIHVLGECKWREVSNFGSFQLLADHITKGMDSGFVKNLLGKPHWKSGDCNTWRYRFLVGIHAWADYGIRYDRGIVSSCIFSAHASLEGPTYQLHEFGSAITVRDIAMLEDTKTDVQFEGEEAENKLKDLSKQTCEDLQGIRKLIVKRYILKRQLNDCENFQALPNAKAKIAEYKDKLKQIKKAEEEAVLPDAAKKREQEWENFTKTHNEDWKKVYSRVRGAVSHLVVVEARNTDIERFASSAEEVQILKMWEDGFDSYTKQTKDDIKDNLKKVIEKYNVPSAVIEHAYKDSKKEFYTWGYKYFIQLFSKEKRQQWQNELEEVETKLNNYPNWQKIERKLLDFLNDTAMQIEGASRLEMPAAKKPPQGLGGLLLHGSVSDADTGKPIGGAKIEDDGYGDNESAVAGSNGSYEYWTWHEEHFVKASAPGYESKRILLKTSFLQQKMSRILNFKLKRIKRLEYSLRPVKKVWQAGENPAFFLDVQNVSNLPGIVGQLNLPYSPHQPNKSFGILRPLFVGNDKKSFNPNIRFCPVFTEPYDKPAEVAPGQKISLEFSITEMAELHSPKLKQPLTPGRYVVGMGYLDNHQKAVSETNLVEVEILPSGVDDKQQLTELLKPYDVNGTKIRAGFIPVTTSVKLGDPIDISFVVENLSEVPYRFAFGGDYRATARHDRFKIMIYDEHGQLLEDTKSDLYGIVHNPEDPAYWQGGGISMDRTVHPRDMWTEVINACDFRKIEKPDIYDVKCAFMLMSQHSYGPSEKNILVESSFKINILPAVQVED